MSYGYQDAGAHFLRETRRAILGDDPGLGKSRQALMAAHGRTLVVAPAMILDAGVWTSEHQLWRPDLDLTQVSYNSLCDVDITEKGGRSPQPRPRPELRGPWDTVICDEAHYVKTRTTTWTQAVERLQTHRLYLLTGTAIPNWAHEIYMLLKLCHPGDRRFTSYWRWVGEWFHQNTVDYSSPKKGIKRPPVRVIGGLLSCTNRAGCFDRSPYDPCDHWLEFQAENLADCYLRRVRDDVLDELPPLTEVTLEVPMVAHQRQVYRSLKKNFIAWTDSGVEVVAWNQAAQTTDLLKCATGVELLDPDTQASGKLDALSELLAERHGQSTLVACHFRETARQCVARAHAAGLTAVALTGELASKKQRGAIVQAFQAGEFEVLVGSLELIKEGLNLHRADHCIFVEHSWRPSTNEQAMRRIHRIGQDRPVTVTHLVTAKSFDSRMQTAIAGKTDQQVRALPVQRIRSMA